MSPGLTTNRPDLLRVRGRQHDAASQQRNKLSSSHFAPLRTTERFILVEAAEEAMAALAQKLTWPRKLRLPLLPRKQTLIPRSSENCQPRKWRGLFDHLVRPREQCGRNGQPVRFCGSQVHDQLKPCRALDRYIGWS